MLMQCEYRPYIEREVNIVHAVATFPICLYLKPGLCSVPQWVAPNIFTFQPLKIKMYLARSQFACVGKFWEVDYDSSFSDCFE